MKYCEKWIRTAVAAIALCVAFAFQAMASVQLGTPETAYWDEANESGIAHWTKVEKAKKYEIVLYEGESRVKRVYSSGTKIDLSEYFTGDGQYYFTVRAVPTDTQRKFSSGGVASSDELDVDWMGETGGRWRKYSTGTKYEKADKSFYTSEWAKIKGKWYYFNADGYMQTSWLKLGDLWYYLNADGEMQTGWVQVENVWYYLNADGVMQTGWVQSKPGFWYYLNSDGAMLSNTVVEGHQLNADGLMIN